MKKESLCELYENIHKRLGLIEEYLHPKNAAEEKKKFLQAIKNKQVYNPQFTYKKNATELTHLRANLMKQLQYKGDFQKEVHEAAKRDLLGLRILENVGTARITAYSAKRHGRPTQNTLTLAKRILKKKIRKPTRQRKYAAAQVKKEMEKVVKPYGWKVCLRDISAKMQVIPALKQLVVNKTSRFTMREIKRLKCHEIEVHVVRQINGQRLPALIRNTFDYLKTEEGLAVTMEKLKRCSLPQLEKIYAARALSVHLALKKSFHDIFMELRSYELDETTAYQITARVKRGLRDTKQPGGYLKDHIYFSGNREVEEFLGRGGKLDDLFLGKIGIKDVPKVKKILREQQKYSITCDNAHCTVCAY